MKTAAVLLAAALLTGCATNRKSPAPPAAAVKSAPSDGKSVTSEAGDDLDMYAVTGEVADPIQGVNRVTFWVNHQLYTYALRPVSKGYEFVMPKKAREALYNAFENIKFPIRFTNNLLQGNPYRATQETGRFLLNSTFGIGGLGKPADHVVFLANVPPADTAQTFAKWGIKNGFYFVVPVLGPTTLRDGIGQVGDYCANPITWAGFIWGGAAWFIAVPAGNTMRSLPNQLEAYDAATKDSLDRYLAARAAYIQYRAEINARAFQSKK
jgi:phospholipid-binding lipoprotein MlaA